MLASPQTSASIEFHRSAVMPEGLRSIDDFPNLTAAMQRAGWSEPRTRKVMGENWLRLLGDVWGA